MVKKITAFSVCLFLLLLSGCMSNRYYEKTGYAMGSLVDIKIYGDEDTAAQLAQDALTAITDADRHLSGTLDGSDIRLLNTSETGTRVSPYTLQVIKTALELCRNTGGVLDITIGAVSELWGFATQTPSRPADESIRTALATVDCAQLQTDEETSFVTKAAGQKIDLGAFGKGAACNDAAQVLQQAEAAVVSVGGTVLLCGNPPDGAWTVGLRNPFGNANDSFGTLHLPTNDENNCLVVSTSGSYEKSFAADGITYHHILSPQTGMPADSDVVAVTVVCKNGIFSDGLSTALFSTGLTGESADILAAYNAEAVFTAADGSCFVSDGLLDRIVITASDAFFIYPLSEFIRGTT